MPARVALEPGFKQQLQKCAATFGVPAGTVSANCSLLMTRSRQRGDADQLAAVWTRMLPDILARNYPAAWRLII